MNEPEELLQKFAAVGNEGAVALCQQFLDLFGGGVSYKCAVGAAATNLVFHAFRVALPEGQDKAIKLLQEILNDVAHNAEKVGGHKVKFKVEKA